MAKKKSPNDPTITQRDKRYRAKRKAAGYAAVRVFVPKADAWHIRNLAKLLRDHYEAGAGFSIDDITESIAKALRDEI